MILDFDNVFIVNKYILNIIFKKFKFNSYIYLNIYIGLFLFEMKYWNDFLLYFELCCFFFRFDLCDNVIVLYRKVNIDWYYVLMEINN